MDLAGVGVWSSQLRYGDAGEAAEAAAELEELGYTALWIPDVGGPVLDSVGQLLSSTKQVVIATGILNLWMHDPSDVAASYASLAATHGERFLLGIGVSHAPLIDSKEPGLYRKPLAATRAYLDALDATEQPVPVANRVLAALGPKMLELAATRSRGAHPYLVTPDHTRYAREHLGDGPLLLPEQTVLLTDDKARSACDRNRLAAGVSGAAQLRQQPAALRLHAGRSHIGQRPAVRRHHRVGRRGGRVAPGERAPVGRCRPRMRSGAHRRPERIPPRAVETAGRGPSLAACELGKHVGAVHSGNLQIHLASDPVFGSYAGATDGL